MKDWLLKQFLSIKEIFQNSGGALELLPLGIIMVPVFLYRQKLLCSAFQPGVAVVCWFALQVQIPA